jgi:hypothetical protein
MPCDLTDDTAVGVNDRCARRVVLKQESLEVTVR